MRPSHGVLALLVSIGCAGAVSGCRTTDAALGAAIDHEVSTLTSMALCEGSRSVAQVKSIVADGELLKSHIREYGQ